MFDKIKKYYDKGLYTKAHIIEFIRKKVLTVNDYEAITGEPLPSDTSLEVPPTDIEILKEDSKNLKAKVSALSESHQFMEDCIVEMADIVYA